MLQEWINMYDWIYGYHAVKNFIKYRSFEIKEVVSLDQDQSVIDLCSQTGVAYTPASEKFFSKFPKGHQGIACLCKVDVSRGDLKDYITNGRDYLIVMLDGVSDPQNLGSCIRSILALGADALIVPKHNSAKVTPITHKVSVGGASLLPVFSVQNMNQTLDFFKKNQFWIYGACERSENVIEEIESANRSVIVLGSEGQGIRQSTRKYIDYLYKIRTNPKFPSLNVAMACTISVQYFSNKT